MQSICAACCSQYIHLYWQSVDCFVVFEGVRGVATTMSGEFPGDLIHDSDSEAEAAAAPAAAAPKAAAPAPAAAWEGPNPDHRYGFDPSSRSAWRRISATSRLDTTKNIVKPPCAGHFGAKHRQQK